MGRRLRISCTGRRERGRVSTAVVTTSGYGSWMKEEMRAFRKVMYSVVESVGEGISVCSGVFILCVCVCVCVCALCVCVHCVCVCVCVCVLCGVDVCVWCVCVCVVCVCVCGVWMSMCV